MKYKIISSTGGKHNREATELPDNIKCGDFFHMELLNLRFQAFCILAPLSKLYQADI